MIREGKGLIRMIEKVLPCEREWQIGMRTMVDQEDHLGVADQCLRKSIDIGAGMNLTHHQGHPEVQQILRCVVILIPDPFPYIFPHVTWLPCIIAVCNKLHPNEQEVRKSFHTLEYQLEAVIFV